ncbi:MAG: glycosyl transferase, partial [Nitrospiraceae bacterium]
MSDFFQNGVVSVLHRLGSPNVEQLERELEQYRSVNPIALVLPSLYSELDGPALGGIIEELKGVTYLREIVVALGQASALEFRRAKEYFKVLPQDVRIVWVDGARVQGLLKMLVECE